MKKEWVLVIDGSRAKILQKDGVTLVHVFPTYHASEILLDVDKDARKPGTIRQTQGFLGNVFSPHEDYRELEKEKFVSNIAHIINQNYRSFDQLSIIAPADRLGDIRNKLIPQVLQKINKEISKDLTKAPLEDVYDYMVELPD